MMDSSNLDCPKQSVNALEWVEKGSYGESGAKYVPIFPEHILYRAQPNTIDSHVHRAFQEQEFHQPETFVALIPKGRVCGSNGFIITPDNKLIYDLSNWFNTPVEAHPILLQTQLPPNKHLEGSIAVLATAGWWNYYHWMFDALPRYEVLRRSGFRADKYIVSYCNLPFQTETLKILGIPREDMIVARDEFQLQADELIVPSFPSCLRKIPKWSCQFLRDLFLPHLDMNQRKKDLRIYVSRAKASFRKLENESLLEERLSSLGFETVYLETLPLLEQVSLFANADIVIAPHGAGLTNLVFCRPGTKVVELMGPKYINNVFWALSNQVDLDYTYLIGEGEEPPSDINPWDSGNSRANFTICPQKFKTVLQKIGLV
ncbi:glycosyltransferase family 61 protein [Heliobacterium chlorum]|uniref:Glycosyltransferase family 61 protein n=2 Tax=Heliobacterium chlorum TaxID=2698 RepID=A0ABR7T3V1_HELCL|nr:glycosyltransferase family 61 protein [Heliobacterium chlorum]